MYQTNLLDETLDRNQAHHYNLFIQWCLSGLSFCLCDTVNNKFIAFRHYSFKDQPKPEDVMCILSTDDLLGLPYKSVNLLLNDGRNTLVPVTFFDEKEMGHFFRFNHGEGDYSLTYNNLPGILSVNIFSYDQTYLAKFNEHFPGIKIFHRTTPFIIALSQEASKGNLVRIFATIHKEVIDIGLAHSKKLEFFNSFNYREKEDIVYYLLNVMEQFKLSVMYTDVYISADLDNHEEIFEYLNNYLHQVKFIKPLGKYTYSYIFDEFQLTRFANLFNLSLCV
jgi:hypothetical protein